MGTINDSRGGWVSFLRLNKVLNKTNKQEKIKDFSEKSQLEREGQKNEQT